MNDAPQTESNAAPGQADAAAKPIALFFWDTETSGLMNFRLPADDPSQPRIVDIAGILCDEHGTELARFESLVKPDGWVMSEEVSAIHGITMEMANESGRPIAEVMTEFDALMARATQSIAYNIVFDDKCARGDRRRMGRPDGFGTVKIFCCMRGATPLCKIPPTAKMSKAGFTKFKTPNLGEAVKILLERDHTGAHRAMVDVIATKEIYFKCRDNQEFMAAGSAFKSNEAA